MSKNCLNIIMNKITVFIFLFFVFFQYSCKKNNPIIDKDIQSITDNTIADNTLQNIFITVNNYAQNYLNKNGSKNDTSPIVTICPQYPIDSFPKTMIIDYGSGVNCNDGKVRKGKIVTTVYNFWQLSNEDSMEVELVNFILDSIKVNSSFVFKYSGNSNNTPKYNLNIPNCKFEFNNGENFQINTNKTINWISGFETINDFSDDVYLIDGKSNGINRKQIGFEANITETLKYVSQCYGGTLTQGKLEITPRDATKRIIDFGNGTCDRIANVTINGVSFDVNF